MTAGCERAGTAGATADMGVQWGDGTLTVLGRSLNAETADRLILTLIRARREAFGRPQPVAPVVEIIEPGHATSDSLAGSVIMPREVRINGTSLPTQGGVTIHEMSTSPKDMARVTLTLPVRMLIVAAEGDLASRPDPMQPRPEGAPHAGRWCEEHKRWECVKPRSRGRGTCHGSAVADTDHCRMHLGRKAAPVVAGARTEEAARQAVITYGLKIETTATEALLDEVQWTAGHVAWLRDRVREIETAAVTGGDGAESALVWGTTKVKTGGDDRGTTQEAAPNVWLKLYQTERAHLVKVCSEAIRAGIEERRVRLAEQQGALVAQVIRAILDDLELTAGQVAKVPEVVPRHLRALAG